MQGQLVCVNHVLSPNACFILTPSLDCVLYTPERLKKIATEVAMKDSVFSLSDCIRLLYNVSELSKAGLTQVSSLLTLFYIWQNEMNCEWSSLYLSVTKSSALDLVWASILNSFGKIAVAFEENTKIRLARVWSQSQICLFHCFSCAHNQAIVHQQAVSTSSWFCTRLCTWSD
jgi:hypothetical protein